MVGPVQKKKAPFKRNTRSENPKPDKRKRRKTSPTTAAMPDPLTSDLAASGAAAPGPAPVTPGSKEFDPDTEFSGGWKVWGTSTNPHTSKIQESQKRLLGPLLAFERAKDWKRQKVNRALKAGVVESEHATVTGAPIGTKRNELSDVQRGKFE
ncbi:hypothetical protein L211DRAFT_853973 [Terfezia boudieri ATCC MYA-4762]|uniref:Uncharacterized protein n=1 Tax=Terfezia boudieri ATCC MYA-4762 TaxID=1051890 RepID=A0A3N4LD46_9PEZI|nr:hypothetical protein L211DRAFT_853973 [Terfezia boudieri ATCC MYA-4762]